MRMGHGLFDMFKKDELQKVSNNNTSQYNVMS